MALNFSSILKFSGIAEYSLLFSYLLILNAAFNFFRKLTNIDSIVHILLCSLYYDCLWGLYWHLITRHNLSTNFVQIVSCHKFSCETMDSVYLIDSERGYDSEEQSLYKRKCGKTVKLASIISIILTMGALVVALLWLLYNQI